MELRARHLEDTARRLDDVAAAQKLAQTQIERVLELIDRQMGRDWWGPFDHIEAPVIPSFDNPLACACRGDGVGGLAWPTGKGWPILNDGIDLLVEFGQGKCLGLRRHDDEQRRGEGAS